MTKRVHYSGRVQGVGFRFTAHRLAQGFPLGGFVRNLSDGRVELIVEGQADEVEAYLAALADKMAGCIQRQDIEDQPAQGFQEFVIEC